VLAECFSDHFRDRDAFVFGSTDELCLSSGSSRTDSTLDGSAPRRGRPRLPRLAMTWSTSEPRSTPITDELIEELSDEAGLIWCAPRGADLQLVYYFV